MIASANTQWSTPTSTKHKVYGVGFGADVARLTRIASTKGRITVANILPMNVVTDEKNSRFFKRDRRDFIDANLYQNRVYSKSDLGVVQLICYQKSGFKDASSRRRRCERRR